MPTTPGGLRYPAAADTPNVPRDLEYLATDVETALGAKPASADIIPRAIFDAKGDLIVGTADNTFARLAAGTDGQALVLDSTTATGVKWATPATASAGVGLDSVFLLMGA
jgi:hypothetical protein